MKNSFRNKILICLLAVLFCSCSKEHHGILELTLLSSSVRVKDGRGVPSDSVSVKFRLANKSEIDILLYDFKNEFEYSEIDPATYCDSLYRAAENLVFIFNSRGEQILPTAI